MLRRNWRPRNDTRATRPHSASARRPCISGSRGIYSVTDVTRKLKLYCASPGCRRCPPCFPRRSRPQPHACFASQCPPRRVLVAPPSLQTVSLAVPSLWSLRHTHVVPMSSHTMRVTNDTRTPPMQLRNSRARPRSVAVQCGCSHSSPSTSAARTCAHTCKLSDWRWSCERNMIGGSLGIVSMLLDQIGLGPYRGLNAHIADKEHRMRLDKLESRIDHCKHLLQAVRARKRAIHRNLHGAATPTCSRLSAPLRAVSPLPRQ